ncbi:MAG TPA: hypothetical protein PK406_00710 [Verrucomicrobiota bacterium]|nr:hypothetical protein [Verrucomicrobiota bacterium]
MTMLAQWRMVEMAERLGLCNERGELEADKIMAMLGALAERAYMPQQGLSERHDQRLAHADLPGLSDTALWRENLRAEFVAAWGDDRTGWVVERARAIREEQRRRAAMGK